jgi:hypothetical protein
MRGNVLPVRPERRHRSTRRRQDAPPLPRRMVDRARSVGPTPRRTARPSGSPCSSRSPARPTAR